MGQGRGEGRGCAATKPDGSPCKNQALERSLYCWAHCPEQAAERHRIAVRGGLAKTMPKEIRDVKSRIRELCEGVIKGEVDKGKASVAFQGLGVWAKLAELERRVKETEELEKRIEELEEREREQQRRGVYGW
jgi:hypothetical protein